VIGKMWDSEISVNTQDSEYLTIICHEECKLLVSLAFGSHFGDIFAIFMSALNVLEKGRNRICLCHIKQFSYPDLFDYSVPYLLMGATDDKKVLFDTKQLVCESSDSSAISRIVRLYHPDEVSSLKYLSSCSIRQVSSLSDSFSEDYLHSNFLTVQKVKLRFHTNFNVPDVTCHCE